MLVFLGILLGIGWLFFLAHNPRFDEERPANDKFVVLLGVVVISAVLTVLTLLLKGGM